MLSVARSQLPCHFSRARVRRTGRCVHPTSNLCAMRAALRAPHLFLLSRALPQARLRLPSHLVDSAPRLCAGDQPRPQCDRVDDRRWRESTRGLGSQDRARGPRRRVRAPTPAAPSQARRAQKSASHEAWRVGVSRERRLMGDLHGSFWMNSGVFRFFVESDPSPSRQTRKIRKSIHIKALIILLAS